jgi:hypothetical protein
MNRYNSDSEISFDSESASAGDDVPITREEVTLLCWLQQIGFARLRRRLTRLESVHGIENDANTPSLRSNKATVRDRLQTIRNGDGDE